MQYVNVAINGKTKLGDDLFTYKIPPEFLPYIKAGILVTVPFGSREKEAIIVSLKSRLADSSATKKLKSIRGIITYQPMIDNMRFNLGYWMRGYYWSSLGQTVFSMIPAVAKRQIKKDFYSIELSPSSSLYMSADIDAIHDRLNNRLNLYFNEIVKTFNIRKQALILFPDIEKASYFNLLIKKKYERISTIVYHHNLTKTRRYKAWKEISEGKYDLVIGTRSSIFSPLPKLNLIILDTYNDRFSYKEEQAPYYDSLVVAKKISEMTGVKLILGDLTPSIESYFYLRREIYSPVKTSKKQLAAVRIISVNNNPDKRIISYQLEGKIRDILNKGQKTALFLNRKGEQKIWYCLNCQEVIKEEKKDNFLRCANCQNSNLKEIGIDIPNALTELKLLFPKSKITALHSYRLRVTRPQRLACMAGAADYLSSDIIIATSSIFYLSQKIKNIGLIGVISVDYELNFPYFRSSENVFLLLSKLAGIAPLMLIQTEFPDNPVMQTIASGKYKNFYENELKSRSRFDYPPFSQLLKFILTPSSSGEKEKEMSRIIKFIQSVTGDKTIQYFYKERDNKIELTFKLKKYSSHALFNKMKQRRKILPISNVKIEVDPIA